FQDDDRVVGTGDDARGLSVGLVSASFWSLFDVRPEIGRFFTPDEDRVPRGTNVAVLGYGYWKSQFGGDKAVLGRQLRIGGGQYTIIGVVPKGFQGIWYTTTAAYVPITGGAFDLFGTDDYYRNHGASWLEMIGRLRPNVTPEAASAELTRAYRQSRVDARAAQ